MANRFNFRAYVKKYNKIYKVCELHTDNEYLTVQIIDNNNTIIFDKDKKIIPTFFSKNEIELMQSTGLVDGNGEEIYEGDILVDGNNRFLVKFDEERAWFVMKPILCGKILLTHYEELGKRYMHYYKIIGNIYENKDLLESNNEM